MRRVLMVGHDASTSLPTSAPGGATSEPADAIAARPAAVDLFCPGCGYNLRGIDSDRCPECGLIIDREALARTAGSLIPWVHRRQIGRWRAYWRTVWMVLRHPSKVAAEVTRPVSYRDAQKFRWVTAFAAAIPLAALLAWQAAAQAWSSGWYAIDWLESATVLPWAVGVVLPGATPVYVLLFIGALSGVHSYFYHPQRLSVVQQNRAVAISAYAVAALLLLWIPLVLSAGALLLQPLAEPQSTVLQLQRSLVVAAGLSALVWVAWTVWIQAVLLHRAAHCSAGTAWLIAPSLLLVAAALGILLLIGFPWLVGYVAILVYSLL